MCRRCTTDDVFVQVVHDLTVLVGCASNTMIVFDWITAKARTDNASQIPIDCRDPDPGMPCFYYSNGTNSEIAISCRDLDPGTL